MEQILGSYVAALTGAFLNPDKRLFLGYLGSALLIALVWLVGVRRQSPARAAAIIFDRASWWSRSARADYAVMALNSAIMLALSPRLLAQLGVSIVVFEWMHGVFHGRPGPPLALPDWAVAASFTFALFVMDDLSRYVVHRLLHRLPVLWAFHKVHHTAASLNPLTVYRTHPVEGVIYVLRSAVVHGACTGAFVFFFGDQVTLATVMGAAVFSVAFNALGANLRHSNVALGYWKPVERLFISPAQHQIHHSSAQRHVDRNFGAVLAVWDVLFRTHAFSEPGATLVFGVKNEDGDDAQSLFSIYTRPFVESGRAAYAAVASARRFLVSWGTRIHRSSGAAGRAAAPGTGVPVSRGARTGP